MSEGCLMETEGFIVLCDRDGGKGRFANSAFPKRMEMEVCKICVAITDKNRGFADFAFPKSTEMEVCQFCISITDGNKISISVHFRQAHFPFSIFRVRPYCQDCQNCSCACTFCWRRWIATWMLCAVVAPLTNHPWHGMALWMESQCGLGQQMCWMDV